jgi:hypothetical protein
VRKRGPAAVAPTGVLRKGGNSALSTLSPEVADQVTHGVVAVTRSLGDVLQGMPLDEKGAEHLIAAVQRVGGFEEEAQAEGIVHDLAPRCRSISVGFLAPDDIDWDRWFQGAVSRGALRSP